MRIRQTHYNSGEPKRKPLIVPHSDFGASSRQAEERRKERRSRIQTWAAVLGVILMLLTLCVTICKITKP
jgi:hypothetical protein